jgi:mono/diheme cytochrome c family protein
MHLHLHARRRRVELIAAGLIVVSIAGEVCSLSVADARTTDAPRTTRITPPTTLPPDGKQIFATTCAACHQATGQGVEGTFPPLAGSDWVTGDEAKLVRIVLHGLTGPVEVAGETYTGAMPAWGGVLKDPDVAAVTTYIRSSWGNQAAPITEARVASIRAATASRKTPWTAAELAQLPSLAK